MTIFFYNEHFYTNVFDLINTFTKEGMIKSFEEWCDTNNSSKSLIDYEHYRIDEFANACEGKRGGDIIYFARIEKGVVVDEG